MQKTLITLTLCASIIGASVWYARAVDQKSQTVQSVKEKKGGQVTIVTHEATYAPSGESTDALKARIDEALERVGRVEEWNNQLEERITKLEEKAEIKTIKTE